jgi:hypothetical protein
MKINRLETHDRYLQFTAQSTNIAECVQDIVKQRPFGDYCFYIFAHTRTIGLDEKVSIYNEDLYKDICDPNHVRKYKDLSEVPEARLIWHPRLTKPKSQSNSMLFKVYPGSDEVKIIWMIPKEELWGQYDKGKVTEDNQTYISIQNFQNCRELLDAPEKDDLGDSQINQIYKELSQQAKYSKMMDSLYTKPKNEVASLIF